MPGPTRQILTKKSKKIEKNRKKSEKVDALVPAFSRVMVLYLLYLYDFSIVFIIEIHYICRYIIEPG